MQKLYHAELPPGACQVDCVLWGTEKSVFARRGPILQRYVQRCESAYVDNAQVDNTQD